MRAALAVVLVGVAFGLVAMPAGAHDKDDHTREMAAAARAFLKAYQAKDVDGMMAVADAPFGVGPIQNPRVMRTNGDLKNELRRRMAQNEQLPTKSVHALTWDKAITKMLSPDEERSTRARLKAAMDITGPDGGYTALGDPVPGKKNQTAMSDKRLLVGMRDGKAMVLGIISDR
jgi:hypothetical protein